MNWIEKLRELKLTPENGVQFLPMNEAEISQLENTIGNRFPEPYRFFLSVYGASDFEEYGIFPTDGGGVAPGRFFGRDLPRAINDFQERLPRLVIPINDDGAGNLICVSLREDSYGSIYYQSHSVGWNESNGDADGAKLATLVHLASDFTSFIMELEVE